MWLAALTLLTFLLSGVRRRIVTSTVVALCGLGALVCLAMIAAESFVYEFSSPLSIAGYAVLLATFGYRVRGVAALALAGLAYCYLFVYGGIPNIVELPATELTGLEGVNVLGGPSGTLPVTEFADFECGPCAVQDGIMDQLWGTYSDRIRYSFRHFPKVRHPHAEPAALASQCAAEQGAFWETKRLLFFNQDRLGEILGQRALPTIPAGKTESYAACLKSRSAWGSVRKDREWAENLGLRLTPSIIIGNKLIQGVTGYSRLALIVRRELSDRKLAAPQRAAARSQSGCGSAVGAQGCSE
jgi:protein-disulfide isomerase